MSDDAGLYLICFDFPDDDDPMFAKWVDASGSFELTSALGMATRFFTRDAAERTLRNSYAPWEVELATIVETETA